jgi:hypothetical protein
MVATCRLCRISVFVASPLPVDDSGGQWPKAVLLTTFYSLELARATPFAAFQGVAPSRRPFY